MKTLLIVEDEKAIRLGISAMVQRAPVPIETILECKNGIEAMEILQSRSVDVMITDIRMPKMDGIELVTRVQSLPHPPLVVVISGYDDFSYAVSVFRQGVYDYILKPVERDLVFKLLAGLDAQLTAKEQQRSTQAELQKHLLRSLLLGSELQEAEFPALAKQCEEGLPSAPLVVICMHPGASLSLEKEDAIFLPDMEGHAVLIASEADLPNLCTGVLARWNTGISDSVRDITQIQNAYRQALRARKFGFIRGESTTFSNLPDQKTFASADNQVEKVFHALGAGHIQEAKRTLEHLLFSAQNGKIPADHYASLLQRLLLLIDESYGAILPDNTSWRAFGDLWQWNSAYDHHLALCTWLGDAFTALENTNAENVQYKILQALAYLREHFRSDINMAVVSNFVSMNYSQFSSLFKKHTGLNFLDYLKNLRLEEGKRLLAESNYGIREISRRSGFKNEKHFMRAFKQQFGISPSAFREKCRKEEALTE